MAIQDKSLPTRTTDDKEEPGGVHLSACVYQCLRRSPGLLHYLWEPATICSLGDASLSRVCLAHLFPGSGQKKAWWLGTMCHWTGSSEPVAHALSGDGWTLQD